ncbi:hypothetical protein EIL87_10580 [Saccharopolyspora rhizosphaerae]|uniref:ATP-binding protein n=1 Tax=Saccharopolyspora rhizosphaerae TaxID=2492662 RepID=A0A3R8Q2R1_9PSEU|nr:hypothetical protein [Saccharopolyspora rhizosphaerae]RRO17245.1 hypothetical protein EIL87_10580 [Saccharopolyspora rhizosphaerae]
MKRTFTAAAAVLAGGAGAVGFATTATAAESPQLPASLPTDNGVANTVFHAAGTVASAQKTVGDVVPLEQQLTGRSGDPVSQVVSGTPVAGVAQPVVDAVQNASTGHTHSLDPASALDEAPLPVGSTLPAEKSGLPGLDALGPVADVASGLPVLGSLPAGKSGLPGLDALGPVADVASGLPVLGSLPAGKSGLPGLDALGPVADVASGLPVLGSLPAGKSGLPGLDALGPVTDVTGGLPVADSLPVGKTGATDALPTTLTGTLDQATQSAPQTKPAQPVQQLPTNVVGDTVSNVLEGNTELGGAPLPTGKSDPVGGLTGGLPVVSDVVSHGPLGSTTQLGS